MRWTLLLLLLACGAAWPQHAHTGAQPGAAAQPVRAASAFDAAMTAGMDRMMRDMHAPGYTGNPDVDFLAMMIPHHEGAVEMARLMLVHGRDPIARQLAEDIIASQTVEIEGMKRRLAILRGGASPGNDASTALGGTRGPVVNETKVLP